MSSTDDGIPLIGGGRGDPQLLRKRIAEAREITEPPRRAARLYFLGRGLFDCNDESTVEEAVTVLREAMELGSTHAAFDLGMIVLGDTDTPEDLNVAVSLLQRAASGGHEEAVEALKKIRQTPRLGAFSSEK
jgi:TPR repeat protein